MRRNPLLQKRKLLLVGLMGFGCLPAETRSPPGSLTVTATGSAHTVSGVSTVDGWNLNFDRALLSIGYVSLGAGRGLMRANGSCDLYAGANYGRILDVTLLGAQRVSEVFALGDCEFGFRVPQPASNAVLGAGVSEADRAYMRMGGADSQASGGSVTLFVSGSAAGDRGVKGFRWAFRRPLDYEDCVVGSDSGAENVVHFAEGSPRALDIRIRVEAIFQDELDETRSELRFGAFALADDEYGNGDGEVSLEELGQLPLSDSRVGLGSESAGKQAWTTLADWVILGLLPTVPRVGGKEACSLGDGASPSKGPGFL